MKLPWEKIEKIKKSYKLGIFFGTIVVLGAVFFFLLYQPIRTKMADTQKAIDKLENQEMQARNQARVLPKIKKELKRLKLQFEYSSTFLTEGKEIDKLLQQISDHASKSGLNVLLIQMSRREVLQDFYAEINFDLKLEGPYLQVANFFYNIGRLDRIVNIENIQMGSPTSLDGQIILKTSCLGKTFRLLTEEELKAREEARLAAEKKAAKLKKKKLAAQKQGK